MLVSDTEETPLHSPQTPQEIQERFPVSPATERNQRIMTIFPAKVIALFDNVGAAEEANNENHISHSFCIRAILLIMVERARDHVVPEDFYGRR